MLLLHATEILQYFRRLLSKFQEVNAVVNLSHGIHFSFESIRVFHVIENVYKYER